MDLGILKIKIAREADIETLRNMAQLLVTCLAPDKAGGGYCVVNDHNPPHAMYTGSRENCIAFVEGYDTAPLTDVGCFDHSVNCVCVDTPSCMIVIPEERFGESLANRRDSPDFGSPAQPERIDRMTNGEIIEVAASEGTSESPCSPASEGYPEGWWHCMIHLNPETGEMHSDGDRRVRAWIQDKLSNMENT